MDGFLNLDKPFGFTSHDCVAKIRRILRTKRVGHGGTLDPAATGVLPMAIGRATRLLQYLPSGKAYRATIRFGLTTDTDDLEGTVLTSTPAPSLDLDTVAGAIAQFQGVIQQIPPSYSAIQVQGQRLYDLARSGQMVEAPVRTVEVHQIEILDWRGGEFPELDVAIACGAGTYIRAIARDLGQAVGTGATLAALRRTMSSGFAVDTSFTLDQVAAQMEHQSLMLMTPEQAIAHLPVVRLDAETSRRWCQGQRLAHLDHLAPAEIPSICRVHQASDLFLGVGEWVWREDVLCLTAKLVFETNPEPT